MIMILFIVIKSETGLVEYVCGGGLIGSEKKYEFDPHVCIKNDK